jgi:DNA replication protein DnaC
MSAIDDLLTVLKKLRLSGVVDSLELRLRQTAEESLDPAEFLFRLLHDEVERREAKQFQLRLGRAGFEHGRTMEDFNFAFNPQIPKAKIIDLATGGFVERRDNILFVGPAGVGKSHLSQALGHRAVRRGHTVVFTTATAMFAQLRTGRGDGSYDRRLLRFTGPDLLIVDDLGLRPLRQDEPEDLFELIRARYERGSLIITSNRAITEWPPLFGDPLMASAALDRLLHHAHVIELEGESYRNPSRPRPAAVAAALG